ncbi:hypothetical protein FACS1894206_09400 [Deltaproteobacteria bacterium]|nr:hypothetical protein FACS1894206_09400 [Deltaproteobacteria bacterium]
MADYATLVGESATLRQKARMKEAECAALRGALEDLLLSPAADVGDIDRDKMLDVASGLHIALGELATLRYKLSILDRALGK